MSARRGPEPFPWWVTAVITCVATPAAILCLLYVPPHYRGPGNHEFSSFTPFFSTNILPASLQNLLGAALGLASFFVMVILAFAVIGWIAKASAWLQRRA